MKVYEPKISLCEICKEKDGILLPICENEGKRFFYPVCAECKDKVPYKIIPVITVVDKGYYFIQEYKLNKIPKLRDESGEITPNEFHDSIK